MTFRQIFISTILILTSLTFFGQTYEYEFKNSTGRYAKVISTSWDKDSIKSYSGEGVVGKNCKPKPCGGYFPKSPHDNVIRIDIIAICDSTKDTLFVRSYSYEEIHKLPFILEMKTGDINKLPPDFKVAPFLLFETDNRRMTFKHNDTINLKLTNRDKIIGAIRAYDKTKLIIETFDKKQIEINRKDIDGIKLCGALVAIGPRVGIPECHYSDVSKSKYKVVHQVLLTRPDGTPTKYVWKELR